MIFKNYFNLATNVNRNLSFQMLTMFTVMFLSRFITLPSLYLNDDDNWKIFLSVTRRNFYPEVFNLMIMASDYTIIQEMHFDTSN